MSYWGKDKKKSRKKSDELDDRPDKLDMTDIKSPSTVESKNSRDHTPKKKSSSPQSS